MEQKKKILHINCNYMGTPLHQIMIEHLDAHTDNTVFCPIYDESNLVTKPNANVIVSNCFNKIDRLIFFNKQRKIISALKKSCDVKSFNITHAYTLFTDGNVAYSLKQELGIPYVVAIRKTDLFFFEKRINLRKRGIEILKEASAVFFLAETTRNEFLLTYVPMTLRDNIKCKSYIVPNGIDVFWFENIYKDKDVGAVNKRLQKKDVRIICVAQIIRRKNIPVLQKAVDMLNEKGWKVTVEVIGKAVDKKLLEQIEGHQFTTYHGLLPKEKLINHYRNADIFVLPSRSETFGLVYAEAMTQGLPVIYTRGQGFDGQFDEGEVGYSVSACSSEEIVECIAKIISNYNELSENCLNVISKFEWKDIVRIYYEIYNNL